MALKSIAAHRSINLEYEFAYNFSFLFHFAFFSRLVVQCILGIHRSSVYRSDTLATRGKHNSLLIKPDVAVDLHDSHILGEGDPTTDPHGLRGADSTILL